jgi:hypothetical protein
MKYFLLFILTLPLSAHGQLLKSDGKLTVYDTTAVIETSELANRNIQIISPGYTIFFDRELTLASIGGQIQELENEKNLKDWQLETITQIKRVRNFLASRKTHVWEDFWNELEPIPIDEIEDDKLLTKKLFWELACLMLDSGQFELTINSERQNSIFKTRSNINGAVATVFVSKNRTAFWMCPPITID